MNGRGFESTQDKEFFSSPVSPPWLFGLSIHLLSGYRGESGWGVKLTAHHDLESRLRANGERIPLPLYVFIAWTGSTLHFTVGLREFGGIRLLQIVGDRLPSSKSLLINLSDLLQHSCTPVTHTGSL